jgi:hypothetical protein
MDRFSAMLEVEADKRRKSFRRSLIRPADAPTGLNEASYNGARCARERVPAASRHSGCSRVRL